MANNNKDIKIRDRIYTIPSGYNNIFRDKVLIITGAGRSGTTILGKVIGSMEPAFYLFEPAIMRLGLFLNACNGSNNQIYSLLLRAILFEDYFLQLIHGRNLNFNIQDDSYIGNYMFQSAIKRRWSSLARRQEAVDYIRRKDPLFVIKIPEFQPLFSAAQQVFFQPKFIHIIRNGGDVVFSMIKRGWYTDTYMNKAVVDWVEKRKDGQGCNIPWYLDKESREYFSDWNQITRAASVWRNLVECGINFCAENPKFCIQFRYEDFIKSPNLFLKQFEQMFGLRSTRITKRHLSSIKHYNHNQYPLVYKDIKRPEHNKFISLMKRLGYLD